MRLLRAAFLLACLSGASAAHGQDFYRGKIVKFVVGASVSGGYSAHARVVSRHMPRHIPGNPSIIVQNMPAGAGIAATNHVFNVAEKDGTEVGIFNRYTLPAPLLGVKQAKYDPRGFNWIGTTAGYSDNAYVFIVRSVLPIHTVEDLRKANPPLNVGNIGAAPIRILQETLGLKLNVITGYQGDALDLAFERGETDGHTVGYQTIMATKPHWITKGLARIMIQFGRADRLPLLKDVPTARELALTPADRQLLEFTEAPIMIGYPFALPPGAPPERVAILRKAFDETMADPEFQADMQKANLEFTPKTGAEITTLVDALAATPKDVLDRYRAISGDQSEH